MEKEIFFGEGGDAGNKNNSASKQLIYNRLK